MVTEQRSLEEMILDLQILERRYEQVWIREGYPHMDLEIARLRRMVRAESAIARAATLKERHEATLAKLLDAIANSDNAKLQRADETITALKAQVERLTAPVSEDEVHLWAQELNEKTGEWTFSKGSVYQLNLARAAAPATGAEKVHAPKTIVPEPDQRRIETERFPQKGGE